MWGQGDAGRGWGKGKHGGHHGFGHHGHGRRHQGYGRDERQNQVQPNPYYQIYLQIYDKIIVPTGKVDESQFDQTVVNSDPYSLIKWIANLKNSGIQSTQTIIKLNEALLNERVNAKKQEKIQQNPVRQQILKRTRLQEQFQKIKIQRRFMQQKISNMQAELQISQNQKLVLTSQLKESEIKNKKQSSLILDNEKLKIQKIQIEDPTNSQFLSQSSILKSNLGEKSNLMRTFLCYKMENLIKSQIKQTKLLYKFNPDVNVLELSQHITQKKSILFVAQSKNQSIYTALIEKGEKNKGIICRFQNNCNSIGSFTLPQGTKSIQMTADGIVIGDDLLRLQDNRFLIHFNLFKLKDFNYNSQLKNCQPMMNLITYQIYEVIWGKQQKQSSSEQMIKIKQQLAESKKQLLNLKNQFQIMHVLYKKQSSKVRNSQIKYDLQTKNGSCIQFAKKQCGKAEIIKSDGNQDLQLLKDKLKKANSVIQAKSQEIQSLEETIFEMKKEIRKYKDKINSLEH